MAVQNSVAYLNSAGWTAVTQWAALATKVAGNLLRQSNAFGVAVGNERVFACWNSTAGTGITAASEPTLSNTIGAETTDGTVKWIEVTGQPAVNGDATNAKAWAVSQTWTQGQTIVDSNNNVQVCTTAGAGKTSGTPPWASYTTTGATTTDNAATWVNLGPISNFAVAGWAAPHARLQVPCVTANGWSPALKVASGLFSGYSPVFTSNNHAETQAGNTTPILGATALPILVACVMDNASGAANVPPTVEASTATYTLTGAGNTFALNGIGRVKGLSVTVGSGSGSATITISNSFSVIILENCTLTVAGTGAANCFQFCAVTGGVDLIDTQLIFAATSQHVSVPAGKFRWLQNAANTLAAVGGSQIPTTLFVTSSSGWSQFVCDGIDLSNITGTLITMGNFQGDANFYQCKTNSSLANIATSLAAQGARVRFWNADDSTNNRYNRFALCDYQCPSVPTQTETSIYKVGGSNDGGGVNGGPFSRKIVTSSTCNQTFPYIMDPIIIDVPPSLVGTSITATLAIVSSSSLTNADIWLEGAYLGTSSFPQGYFATSQCALTASPTAWPTDSISSWNASPATPVYQILSVTFTPQRYGPVAITTKIGKASATVYLDQKLGGFGFNSARQYQNRDVMINEGAGGGGGIFGMGWEGGFDG